ncbi:hypothetical protein G5I_11762 [Acromyrmex echinatior]|uniref:Ig-like domain-containing protein n=1 Tax=Acromyrmex echinatior TaxID=103372 RepID=F4X0I3_ACREC|nr:hypothetical protein G5I_11762 [Acromyrmex echinatior]
MPYNVLCRMANPSRSNVIAEPTSRLSPRERCIMRLCIPLRADSSVVPSSDARFGPQHTPGSDAWTLRLDNARKTDSGKYECQVNTEPKIMYAVQLSVRDPDKPEGYDEPHSQQTRISYESTAPVADIMGPREQRVPSGSTITLRCVILSPYQTRPIRGVQWLRDNKLLTFQPLGRHGRDEKERKDEMGREGEEGLRRGWKRRKTAWACSGACMYSCARRKAGISEG